MQRGLATLSAVAVNPAPDIVLTSLDGDARPLEEWLTTFHLASVVLDPYTNESSWILRTAARVLETLPRLRRPGQLRPDVSARRGAHVPRPARRRLPGLLRSRSARSSRGSACRSLPAFVFLRTDGTVQAAAEGWNADRVARGGRRHRHSHRVDRGPTSRQPPTRGRSTARPPPLTGWPTAGPHDRQSQLGHLTSGDAWLVARRGRRPAGRRCARPPGRRADRSQRRACWSRRRAPARRPSSRCGCSSSSGWATRRIVMLEPRRLATRAAAHRMASLHRRARRRHRRLPDPRRAAHRSRRPASRW